MTRCVEKRGIGGVYHSLRTGPMSVMIFKILFSQHFVEKTAYCNFKVFVPNINSKLSDYERPPALTAIRYFYLD